MSEVTREIAALKAQVGDLETQVEALASRLQAVEATLERAERAVPCGFSAERRPISMQVVGRPFDEVTVLRVGHAYEQATEWHRQRPTL